MRKLFIFYVISVAAFVMGLIISLLPKMLSVTINSSSDQSWCEYDATYPAGKSYFVAKNVVVLILIAAAAIIVYPYFYCKGMYI